MNGDARNIKVENGNFPAAAWKMLWAIFLTIITTAFSFGWFVASLSARVEESARAVIAINKDLRDHERIKGHPGVVERLDSQGERLDRAERKLDRPGP